MSKFLGILRSSAGEFRRVRTIAVSGMLTALNVVLHFTTIVVTNLFQIRFSFVAIAASAYLYGPVVAGVLGAVGDILKYIVYPTGPYFPGITLNEFVAGAIYGFILYNHKVTLARTTVSHAVVTLVVKMGMLPVWLHLLYGTAYELIYIDRLKALIIFPAEVFVLYLVLRLCEKVGKRSSV